MAAAGWVPTVETYLGRVPKARILGAVREAKGERAAQLIDHLKKPEMAQEAERLLAGTFWLPEPLRTPGASCLGPSSAFPSRGWAARSRSIGMPMRSPSLVETAPGRA